MHLPVTRLPHTVQLVSNTGRLFQSSMSASCCLASALVVRTYNIGLVVHAVV